MVGCVLGDGRKEEGGAGAVARNGVVGRQVGGRKSQNCGDRERGRVAPGRGAEISARCRAGGAVRRVWGMGALIKVDR